MFYTCFNLNFLSTVNNKRVQPQAELLCSQDIRQTFKLYDGREALRHSEGLQGEVPQEQEGGTALRAWGRPAKAPHPRQVLVQQGTPNRP